MATVTGMTAEKMLQLADEQLVGGSIDGSGHLILTKRGGGSVDAGLAKGAAGTNGVNAQPLPVGSIYMSVSSTNPGAALGGTWIAWGSGRVPVGVDAAQSEFNTVEETGGEKTHTLTVNEIPSHAHGERRAPGSTAGTSADVAARSNGAAVAGFRTETDIHSSSGFNSAAVGDGAHNNLQPYITCYMWKRTA